MTPRARTLALIAIADVAAKLAYATVLLPYGQLRGAEDFYDDLARNLITGHGFVIEPGGAPISWRVPLYPLFLAAVYALSGEAHLAVVGSQLLLDALTCLVLYVIADSLYGRPVALWATGLFIVYPFSAYYVFTILTEPLFTLLLALIVLHAGRQGADSVRGLGVTGVLIGLAALCRPSVQYFALVILLRRYLDTRSVRRAAVGFCAVIAGVALVVMPWAIRNYRLTGAWIPLGTGAGYNLWLGNHQPTAGMDTDELSGAARDRLEQDVRAISGGAATRFGVEQDRRFYAAAMREVLDQPVAASALIARKAWRFWFHIYHPAHQQYRLLVIPVQALLLAACVVGVYHLRSERAAFYPLAAILYFNVIHALTLSTLRYSIPVMPYVIVFAAYGASRMLAAARKR